MIYDSWIFNIFYMIVRNVYNREFKLASSSMFVGINMLYN